MVRLIAATHMYNQIWAPTRHCANKAKAKKRHVTHCQEFLFNDSSGDAAKLEIIPDIN